MTYVLDYNLYTIPLHPSASTHIRLLFICLSMLSTVVDAQPEWRVERTPLLRISASTTSGNPIFGTATWATLLRSGDIAVADGSDRLIRIFGPDGAPKRVVGREGRGPGEFMSVGWIAQCGTDLLFAWDFILARVTVLHPDSGQVRTWASAGLRSTQRVACSARAEIAFAVRFNRTAEARPVTSATTSAGGDYRVWLDTFDVQTYDASGATRRDVRSGVRQESIVGRLPDGRFSALHRPLGVRTEYAFSGEFLVLAQTDSAQATVLTPGGQRSHTFRVERPTGLVSAESYQLAVANVLLEMPAFAREQLGAFALTVPPPARGPAFYGLFSDPGGLLWFVISPLGERTTRIRSYRPTGEVVASITIPAALAIFEIGNDYVLGRTEDEDGEQQLVLYRFARP